MCFESSYKFKCTLSCYIKSHTFWGIWSNSLTFCSLKSQNLENPTDPFSCSDLSKWCASFSDMRRYQLCIVFFTFSPELVNSWMIACSFLLRHVMKPHFFSNNLWQVWLSLQLDILETDVMIDTRQLVNILLPSLQEQIVSFKEIMGMNGLIFLMLFHLPINFDMVQCFYFECPDNFVLQLLPYWLFLIGCVL